MELTKDQYTVLLRWAKNNFQPRQTINREISAYTIHGIFERLYDKGFYVDENSIVDVLKECGYFSEYVNGQYYFNVSKKSRALQIYYSSLGDPAKACPFEWL